MNFCAKPGLRYCKFLTHFIISIAVLENVPPDAGLQKRATFSTLNVGLAGIGDRAQATCVASSVAQLSTTPLQNPPCRRPLPFGDLVPASELVESA
jgi:hypothetical protein